MQNLNQWACKAKELLQHAYNTDAIYTPNLREFIRECPAIDPSCALTNGERFGRDGARLSSNLLDFDWENGPYTHVHEGTNESEHFAGLLKKK